MSSDEQQQLINNSSSETITVSLATRQVFVKQSELQLTGLEYNLLTLLLDKSPDVVPYQSIAEQVFAQAYANCKASLCTHICHLRAKLAAIDSNWVIKSIRGQGYYLVNQQLSDINRL